MPSPFSERLGRRGLSLAAGVCLLALAAILAFLLYFAWPLSQDGRLGLVLSWHWRPFQGQFGILPMLLGSLCLGFSSLLLAFPLGVGVVCCAQGLGPAWLARPLIPLVRFMSGVPTVVYGFVAVFLLVPLVRQGLGRGSGFCWFSALLVLALLTLPTIVLLVQAQFQILVPRLAVTAAALGLSQAQTLRHLVLPLSWRGLAAAAVLGLARGMGDTLLPLMLSGNAAQVPHSLSDSLRTLTAHIALVLATDSQGLLYASLFACGLCLFMVSLLTQLALHWLRAQAGKLALGGAEALP